MFVDATDIACEPICKLILCMIMLSSKSNGLNVLLCHFSKRETGMMLMISKDLLYCVHDSIPRLSKRNFDKSPDSYLGNIEVLLTVFSYSNFTLPKH